MISYKNLEIWFVAGSQHLYGSEVLDEVTLHSKEIAAYLNRRKNIHVKIKFKALLTTPEGILKLCKEANNSDRCIGLITWMHTFSPSKMWINGLKILHKPLLHLHTQYNEKIPWNSIDMNFMNLNQSAHGGREFGFINTQIKTKRKVVVGHWKDNDVIERINIWSRVAAAWRDSHTMKIARFGDNMRQVAVTEGNKVSAHFKFGYQVDGFGLGDLVSSISRASKKDINQTVSVYLDQYHVPNVLSKKGKRHQSLIEAARIEVGIRSFLEEGGYTAFTDTFENLTGLTQLPGIATQRLMADGYGFGAEGDWKTAALVRTMKFMSYGLEGGNSFMEDYTYHFDGETDLVLGAHMLEICPSITKEKPVCDIHPLGIGGKDDPVRLIFTGTQGPALNATILDVGNRFRLLVNKVEAVQPVQDLPKLPVARVLWKPQPNLKTAAQAWILAGGSHHTCYSQNITTEYLEDFSEMADIEILEINKQTEISRFKQDLRNNEVYYAN